MTLGPKMDQRDSFLRTHKMSPVHCLLGSMLLPYGFTQDKGTSDRSRDEL